MFVRMCDHVYIVEYHNLDINAVLQCFTLMYIHNYISTWNPLSNTTIYPMKKHMFSKKCTFNMQYGLPHWQTQQQEVHHMARRHIWEDPGRDLFPPESSSPIDASPVTKKGNETQHPTSHKRAKQMATSGRPKAIFTIPSDWKFLQHLRDWESDVHHDMTVTKWGIPQVWLSTSCWLFIWFYVMLYPRVPNECW